MQPLFGPVPEPGPLEILLMFVVSFGLPLVVAGLLGKVLYDRLRREEPSVTLDPDQAPVSSKWWWLIAAQPVGYLLLFATTIPVAFLSVPILYLLPLIGFLWFIEFASPVAVYFDRKYAVAVSDWSPSLAYFLVFVPFVGLLLAAIYVYERHQNLGVP